MAVNFFFLGLVIGIIPMLLRRALETPFKGVSLVGFVAMFGVMVLLAVVSSQSGASTGAIEQLDLLLAVRLCLVGVLAAGLKVEKLEIRKGMRMHCVVSK